MSDVLNLSTGLIARYHLPPKEALRNAYYQQVLNNHNTWEYPTIHDVSIIENALSYSLGDIAVYKDGRSISDE